MPSETFTRNLPGATGKTARARWLLPALLALAVAACGPNLTTDSELSTRVSDLKDTMKCRHLGNARVAIKLKLNRSSDKTAEHLLVKARNLASKVGADTVVASGEVTDGEQSFRLYICNTAP